MKKLFVLTGMCFLVASTTANAQVSVGINLGEPVYAAPVYENPGYVVAPDWPSEHYDHHRHRHNDYWARREHWDHDRDHDRGNHNGWDHDRRR